MIDAEQARERREERAVLVGRVISQSRRFIPGKRSLTALLATVAAAGALYVSYLSGQCVASRSFERYLDITALPLLER